MYLLILILGILGLKQQLPCQWIQT